MGRVSLVLGAVWLTTGVATVVAAEVGRLPDQFRVDQSGTASYSVPLTLPPGPGLVPSLGFGFSSSASYEGAVGVGWGFNEPPTITRCGQNRRLDGKITAVQMSSADRFCGPGGRLILASGVAADYGKTNTSYHSELDPTTRYQAKGSVTAGFVVSASVTVPANGPACFVIHTKDGREQHYIAEDLTASECTDALVAPKNVRLWRLTKELSRVVQAGTSGAGGDSREISAVRYEYADVDPDATRESPHLSKIYYGNTVVELSYTAKPLGYARFGYFAGRKTYESMLLQSVNILQKAKLIRSYALSYETSPDTEHQRLTKITRKDERNAVMLTTGEVNLAWSNLLRVGTVKNMTFNGVFARYGNQAGAQLSDKDGDGIPEILVREAGTSGTSSDWFEFDGTDRCVPSTPTCTQDWNSRYTATMPVFAQSGSTQYFYNVEQVDINADGYGDLVVLETKSGLREVWLNDGKGNFAKSVAWSTALPDTWLWWQGYGDMGSRFADLNGDGRTDIIQTFYPNGSTNFWSGLPQRRVFLNNGSGFTLTTSWGVDDLYFSGHYNGTMSDMGARLADINGDGLPDLIQLYVPGQTGWYGGVTQRRIYLNTGAGFVRDSAYSDSSFGNAGFSSGGSNAGTELVDVNGDGLVDLLTLKFNGASGYFREVLLNTGFAFVADAGFAASLPDTYFAGPDGFDMGSRPMDFNGDGLVDLVQLYYSPDTGWYGNAPQRRVFINVGGKFVYRSDLSALLIDTYFSGSNGVDMGTRVADVDGDGLPEFVQAFDPTGTGWYGNATVRRWHQPFAGNADNLSKITDGFGAETVINYKPSTSGIYKKGAGAAFPLIDTMPPGELVSSVETSNGVSGRNAVGYLYGGARISLDHGSLGFAWHEVLDPLNGSVAHSEFNQTFPYIGLLQRSQGQYCTTVTVNASGNSASGCKLLKQQDNTFNAKEFVLPGGKVYLPLVEGSTEKSWDMPTP